MYKHFLFPNKLSAVESINGITHTLALGHSYHRLVTKQMLTMLVFEKNSKGGFKMTVATLHQKSKLYLNKHVKITAKNGIIYTGKITKVDGTKLYLKVSSADDGTKVHTSFLPFILPLVLFDLLVIVLLETSPRRRFY